MSPGPSLAPAPAPGPGGPHHHFNGEKQVNDFIHTLLHYGGYNEMADILVNLTSLAVEMGRLVSEGYILTVLAPNDEAMAKLTTEQLSEPGAPERIMYYHIIPEYQTEESMYNAVRRFGKVRYDTLRLPHKVVAQEADGSVKFGHGDGSAYLFDPDIYTDGRISVQGIDGVLFPTEEEEEERVKTTTRSGQPAAKVVFKHRRGKVYCCLCCFFLVLFSGLGKREEVIAMSLAVWISLFFVFLFKAFSFIVWLLLVNYVDWLTSLLFLVFPVELNSENPVEVMIWV